jgi:phosphate transport system ATP-binding protein
VRTDEDALEFAGDGATVAWSATGGGLELSLGFASLSCRLELTGFGRALATPDCLSLPDVTVAGSITHGAGVTLGGRGQGWIERNWAAAAPEPDTRLMLCFDGGERLRLETFADGRRPGRLLGSDGSETAVDDLELAPTGWISPPGGSDWVPWGWRGELPRAVGATRSLELEPYSRRDVYQDDGRVRFLGAARLLGDDGPVGFALAEALAAPAPAAVVTTPSPRAGRIPEGPPAFKLVDVGVSYGDTAAVAGITLDIPPRAVTALIGPSGAGKSTLIRALNRMNDLVLSASVTGQVLFHEQDLYSRDIDPVQVRRRIGMVFQKPNPFPKSIYDNVAFGPRALGMDDHLDERVEEALRRAALWEEVEDRLKSNAFSLSGGQQQRLVIARALATRPDVLLMDEPASALDPFSTARIEDLMVSLRDDLTIVVVTHNMQQAARVADMTAFMTVEDGVGTLVEYAPTEVIFTRPRDPRTEAYVTGRFG